MISEDKRKVLEIFAEGRRSYKLMKFAESFLQANMKDKAIIKYEELVRKYPATAAGKTAKAKLAALGE